MKRVRMHSNRAFTLMELLVVIMIIGIILGISIPSVINLQKNQNEKKFNYFTTIVGEAADLYVEKYGKSFDESENCFDIPYDSLVDEELIQESDITCLSTEGQQGIVQATRVAGTNNFTYQYYLTCTDRTTGEVFHETGSAPTGCKGVNGNFIVNIESAVKVVDEISSNYTFDTWTRGKVIITLTAVNPYFYEIDHYEYSLDGQNYTRMVSNQIAFEVSMNSKVYFRAIDTNGNVSGDTTAVIKIDNDKPIATLSLSGSKGNNDWYISDVTGSCQNQNDGTGSGVASCTVDPTSQTASSNSATFTLTVKDYAGNINTVSKTIKIDKDPPVMTGATLKTADEKNYTSGSTTSQDVTISVTATDTPSGIAKYIYSTDNWQTTRDVPSNWIINTTSSADYQVKAIDNAGNKSSNTVKFTVKVNKIFTVTFNANGGNVNLLNKNVTYNQSYGTLPNPTRDGYAFAGWYTSPTGGVQITANTKVTTNANHTLYAHWNYMGEIKISLSYSGIDRTKSVYNKFYDNNNLYAAAGVYGVFMNQNFTLHADTSASSATISRVVIDGTEGNNIQRSISSPGDYTYTATAYDIYGRSASTSVNVHVFDRKYEFIILAYANGFGRNPIESNGFANWYSYIDRGYSKNEIYVLLLVDEVGKEGYVNCGDDAACWVQMMYRTCLHRDADASGLQAYIDQYNRTSGNWRQKAISVGNSICNSVEANNIFATAGF